MLSACMLIVIMTPPIRRHGWMFLTTRTRVCMCLVPASAQLGRSGHLGQWPRCLAPAGGGRPAIGLFGSVVARGTQVFVPWRGPAQPSWIAHGSGVACAQGAVSTTPADCASAWAGVGWCKLPCAPGRGPHGFAAAPALQVGVRAAGSCPLVASDASSEAVGGA